MVMDLMMGPLMDDGSLVTADYYEGGILTYYY